MKVYEKIRFMREMKGWSQEDMAGKLGISLNGYTNIERGVTDTQLSRLEQIAQTLGVDIVELFTFGEKNIVFVATNNSNSHVQNVNFSQEAVAFELEKSQLLVEQQAKEINYLQEIIALLKTGNQ
jgi:transcriptional regulator with XRE-family HTH domain